MPLNHFPAFFKDKNELNKLGFGGGKKGDMKETKFFLKGLAN